MREFNITGKIIPEQHYHIDLTPHIEKLMALVSKKAYFVINRPRQFGKTTILNFLAHRLRASNDYLPILISFEGLGANPDLSPKVFYNGFWQKLLLYLQVVNMAPAWQPVEAFETESAQQFQHNTHAFCKAVGEKRLVLLIDEVDSIPETVVLPFLRALREMYLERDVFPTFHNVVLAGVHDIKNLKARYRDESASLGSASPFIIAISYELPPFSRENIQQYFLQHTTETGQRFDEAVIARVHALTSGHPWLVSALAKLLVEEIVPDRAVAIGISHLDQAVQQLLSTSNTNFDSLIKHAHQPDLQPIILDILQGKHYSFTPFDPLLNRLAIFGVIRTDESRRCLIGNQIYAQVLLASFHRIMASQIFNGEIRAGAEDAAGRLDFQRVLDKFQAFMKTKGADLVRSNQFKEATGELLLLSYLDLLVNGKGWTFKQVQSGEGRIDVICCYGRQKEVVELKLWYGERRYEDGLEQLVKYLESESLARGYLVVFDRRENSPKEYRFSEHVVAGKQIQAWVV